MRIDREGGEGGEVEQQMLAHDKVVAISTADGKLVQTDGYRTNGCILLVGSHLGLRAIETCSHHPTACALPLDVALGKGGREGELAIVEGVVEVEVESLLRNQALGDVDALVAHVRMSVIGLGGEIHHVEAIAIAIGVEVELEVLALASQLRRVHGKSQSHASISHRHAERSTEVSHHLCLVRYPIYLGQRLEVSAREIATQLDGPSCVGASDIDGVESLLVVPCRQERVAPEELAVIACQVLLYLAVMLHEFGFLLVAHLALVKLRHQDGVAPLQHLALVRRLADLHPKAIRHLKNLTPFLAWLLGG